MIVCEKSGTYDVEMLPLRQVTVYAVRRRRLRDDVGEIVAMLRFEARTNLLRRWTSILPTGEHERHRTRSQAMRWVRDRVPDV